MIEVPYQSLPVDQSDVRYAHGPDSAVQPGVPVGETTEFGWNEIAIYPGTSRKFWVHVPAQYDPAQSASLMVFQDGWWYLDPEGDSAVRSSQTTFAAAREIPGRRNVRLDPPDFGHIEAARRRFDA